MRVQVLSEAVWEGHAKEQPVRDWLAGFDGSVCDSEIEKLYALYLLQQFIYFGHGEIDALLYALFRDHILYPEVQRCLDANPGSDDVAIRQSLANAVALLKVVPVGNVSESAAMLSYRFRQGAGLPTEAIRSMNEVVEQLLIDNKAINHVILTDDFLGTGDQLCDAHRDDVIWLKALGVRVEYVALVAMQRGLNTVIAENLFDSVRAVITMDDSYSLTREPCMFLDELIQHLPLSAKECLDIVKHYGTKLNPKWPMGYGNCGVMIGFQHNTQDNSVPIFWAKSKPHHWTPIFKRHSKASDFHP